MPRQRRLKNEINVVPYIDVMLVLLVIFMVTAPMTQTGTVDLPSVAKVPAPPVEAIVVTVQKQGYKFQLTANSPQETLPKDRVLARVRDAVAKNPEQSVVVAAEKKLSYDEVMSTLDALRKSGVSKVSLLTQSGGQ